MIRQCEVCELGIYDSTAQGCSVARLIILWIKLICCARIFDNWSDTFQYAIQVAILNKAKLTAMKVGYLHIHKVSEVGGMVDCEGYQWIVWIIFQIKLLALSTVQLMSLHYNICQFATYEINLSHCCHICTIQSTVVYWAVKLLWNSCGWNAGLKRKGKDCSGHPHSVIMLHSVKHYCVQLCQMI